MVEVINHSYDTELDPFEAGVKQMVGQEQSYEEAIEKADQQPAAAQIKAAIETSEPSRKIVSFPTSEYQLLHGNSRISDDEYKPVFRLQNKSNPEDFIDLRSDTAISSGSHEALMHSIDGVLDRSTNKSGEKTNASLVAVIGLKTDPETQKEVDNSRGLENIYLVFSGAYLPGTRTFVKNGMGPEQRKHLRKALQIQEVKQREGYAPGSSESQIAAEGIRAALIDSGAGQAYGRKA